jgi:hypothetical protein
MGDIEAIPNIEDCVCQLKAHPNAWLSITNGDSIPASRNKVYPVPLHAPGFYAVPRWHINPKFLHTRTKMPGYQAPSKHLN